MMVKAQLNGFGYVGCLVTKAAFNSGKVNIVSINNTFIDLNTWSPWPSMIPPMESSRAQSRLRMGSPSPSSWSEISLTSNGVTSVLNLLWNPLVSSLPWRRLLLPWRVEPKGSSSLLLLLVMAWNMRKNYDNFLKIVSNAFCTKNCLAPWPKEDCKRPFWEAVWWWLKSCPEHHPCFYQYCQVCGQGHPWAEMGSSLAWPSISSPTMCWSWTWPAIWRKLPNRTT